MIAAGALPPARAEQVKIGPFAGEFGYSVALDGDTLAVGAPSATPNGEDATGEVRVYVRNGDAWDEQGVIFPADARGADRFGDAVALRGDTLVVGAPQHDAAGSDAGAVYVYVRVAGAWGLSQKLIAANAMAGDRFGEAVAIDGETFVAGGLGPRVFIHNGADWVEQAELTIDGGALRAAAADISGDWIITGPSGHLFERTDGAWSYRQSIGGDSVAIDGGAALIGSPAGPRGAAEFFAFDGASWVSDSRAFRGFSPDVDNNGAVEQLGRPGPAGGGIASSPDLAQLFYAYGCDSSAPCWPQNSRADLDDDLVVGPRDLALLMSSDPLAAGGFRVRMPRFGASVALDNAVALVGSPDEIRTVAEHTGSAHGFARGPEWHRARRFFAEPIVDGDGIGTAVALCNGVAAVGAVGDTPQGSVVITTSPLAPPDLPLLAVYAQVVDNAGFTDGGLRVDSIDLRLALDGTGEDWTTTVLSVSLLRPGRTLRPRSQTLSPPAWFQGDPPPTGAPAWRNMRSSPNDWPNGYNDDANGHPVNGLGFMMPGSTATDLAFDVTWFEYSHYQAGSDFTYFRIAIRNDDPNGPRPTADFTGVPLLRITGEHWYQSTSELGRPFELVIYEERCLGDLDGDNSIGQSDLGILLGDYGCDDGPGNCPGDVDSDGDTDQSDLGLLLSKWNTSCG